MPETPARRSPGRPRKVPDAAKPSVAVAEPVVEETPRPSDPADERIGQVVDDPAWTSIVFMDDSQYRIVDGVIVERVR